MRGRDWHLRGSTGEGATGGWEFDGKPAASCVSRRSFSSSKI